MNTQSLAPCLALPKGPKTSSIIVFIIIINNVNTTKK